ncbi:cytochrome C oxidase subunit IV family protein [Pseudogemmobacter humi]|uniref:Cytochrome C oxidase subunit IV n=1 Tax=Pseudogemmobacter humi TaxID=2483812 RepID=A0A3P5XDM8_9RHOB|nr:cytochrome C oxidase subunit IV family protein [Pseudogemmobacter humi]VDC29437.1 hypothetical protein XINFAN_02332 [Pseudogemmobacter humi]
MDALTRTWLILIALTTASAALAGTGGLWTGAAVLLLAAAKARAILGGFLHLKAAPGWLGAMMLPLVLWLLGLWGVYALSLR